jgi:hypothetical protein
VLDKETSLKYDPEYKVAKKLTVFAMKLKVPKTHLICIAAICVYV